MGTLAILLHVGLVERKQRLFESLVRLRHVERRMAPDQDLAAIRTLLEEELGETMSQRLAARILGVDHKALERWIRAGDLPLVATPSGRTEIPVADVLALHDAVEKTREEGNRRRHYLEPALTEGRRLADEMRPSELTPKAMEGHERAERRSLTYHRALARRLRRPMVDDALRLIWKWRDQGRIDNRYADQWEQVLALPLAEVRRIIGEDSERGRDLRQNSPFAGVLSEAERRRINAEVR
jgi:hypothetical protein